MYTQQGNGMTTFHIQGKIGTDRDILTFLAPGGVGSNILACMSDGRVE